MSMKSIKLQKYRRKWQRRGGGGGGGGGGVVGVGGVG